jgi:hypothetical protein
MATIKLHIPDDELADVDRIRGTIPREQWIRDFFKAAVEARDAFDGPCWLRVKATDRKGPMPEVFHHMIPLDD